MESSGALSLLLPPSGIPLYHREGGVKLRWAVSQSGNVDDRGLGIGAFKSDSYHSERMFFDHVESYRRDSGGRWKVGQNSVHIKTELMDRLSDSHRSTHI